MLNYRHLCYFWVVCKALLEPVLCTPKLRLMCHEGVVEQLLAELALHHLDLVLAGHAAPRNRRGRGRACEAG